MSFDDCTQLQSDIDSIQGWCVAEFIVSVLVKQEPLPSLGTLISFSLNTDFGTPILLVLIILRIWEFSLTFNYTFTLSCQLYFFTIH
jgi:hypothetical protein